MRYFLPYDSPTYNTSLELLFMFFDVKHVSPGRIAGTTFHIDVEIEEDALEYFGLIAVG